MDSNIIDGKKLALAHERQVRQKLCYLPKPPSVRSILVGDDPPSVLYTNMKQKKAMEVGIDFQAIRIGIDEQFEKLVETIQNLNSNPEIDGIMIQLPIPDEFLQGRKQEEVLNLIKASKDIDGLTNKGVFLPAVVRAVMEILEDEEIELAGKNAVVLGASRLVGQPVAKELSQRHAVVKVCDKETPNQEEIIKNADILVSATGVVGLVKGEMVKQGVVVIDVGAEKVDHKVMGDVDFETVAPKASKITPVPGGVGPMTVICLMENVADAANKHL